jgi:hypothetical protein
MKLTVALTLTLLASTAYAGSPAPAPSPHSEASAHSKSAAVGLGVAKAEGGHGGASSATQTQSAEAVSTASNAGNSQSLSIDYRDRLQAPASHAPAVYASGPCAYGWSAAVSVPGGSVGGGKAKPDPSCDRREVARVLTPLNPQLALKVLCADPIVAKVAEEGDCVYTAQEVAIESTGPDAPALDLSRYVTREELVEREKRIVERTTRK